MNKNLYYLKIILAIAGILVSIYLYLIKFDVVPLVCGLSSCDLINQSKYSYIMGIPVSLLGVIFYGILLVLLWFKKIMYIKIVALCGLIFSVYLTYIEAFVLNAFCQWCLFSAWLVLSIFAASLFVDKKSSEKDLKI